MHMSLFKMRKKSTHSGVIIDIGSGSVVIAAITSCPGEAEPTILWSHREHAPLRNIDTIEQSAKAVLTALVNALLKFDSEGRNPLQEATGRANPDLVQCSIAAPWSYTVTKSINFSQDEPFVITENVIAELVSTAERKIAGELDQTDSATKLGLTIVARATMDLLANGYRIKNPYSQKALTLSVALASVVTQKYLVDELTNLKEKLFPSSELHELSHMLAFYGISEDILPLTSDKCLIDITDEATEIGVVREGSLRYATHTPFGAFSLAREIANITNLPLYEAYKHLHHADPEHFLGTLSSSERGEVELVFQAYVKRLMDLFHETGDDLSIPKEIIVHGDLESEALFTRFIEQAAMAVLKSSPRITMMTPVILKSTFPTYLKHAKVGDTEVDTGMLLSAFFFHKQNTQATFEYF